MTSPTGRTSDWFRAEQLEADDPWVDADDAGWDTTLTDDQRAVLEGLEDQPAVPRLRDLDA